MKKCEKWLDKYLKPGEESEAVDLICTGVVVGFKIETIVAAAKKLGIVRFFNKQHKCNMEYWYRPLKLI